MPGDLKKKSRVDDGRSANMRQINSDAEHQRNAGRAAGALNVTKLRGTGTKTYVKFEGRHEHRVIAEKLLGRELLPEEIVHHEDRNKKNNVSGNLVVFASQADHARHHARCYGEEECTCSCIRFSEQALLS